MSETLEVAIIGAGPAGISAAASAAHHGLSHVLLERGQLANTVFDYQKAKLVMAEPHKLPLRSQLPFAEGTREDILATWAEGVRGAGVNLRRGDVSAIRRQGDAFEIACGDEVTRARRVVLAIGLQGTPRRLGVPGEDLPHVAYTLPDPGEFRGRRCLVVGAGDSAIENAVALSHENAVAIVNRQEEFARAKDANVRLVTDAIDRKAIRCFPSSTVHRIEAGRAYIDTHDGVVEIECDYVLVRAGAEPPRAFLERCGIALRGAPTVTVDARYESNVPGLHVVGALIGYPLIKQAMNQGYEVIEHILGRTVEPADAPLVAERLAGVGGDPRATYARIRAGTPLFAELSEPQFREVLIDSTVHEVRAGDVVFERLDYTDSVYSIVEGAVEARVTPERRVRLAAGQFFGEVGLISGRRRTATVVAAERALLVETPRKQMLKLIASGAGVRRKLDEAFMHRSLLTLFPEADPVFLGRLVEGAVSATHKRGEVLMREGDPGEALYVVRKGSLKISARDASVPGRPEVTRTYVPAGNFVGEMELLQAEPRACIATVTAAVGTETIRIDKAHFRQLLDECPEVRDHIERVSEDRRLELVATSGDCGTGAVLDFVFQQGLTDASNVLVIDSDRCVACDNCERACAATHGGEGRLDRKGGKFFASVQVPISCRHCENPLCMLDCPPDALVRDHHGEVAIRDSCIGCGNCVTNCPYGVIRLVHPEPRGFDVLEWLGLRKKRPEGPARAAKCDMCADLAGGPACVRACPTGAAIRISPVELQRVLGRDPGGRNGGA